ncbi:MAG: hypothetical protein ACLFTH_03595 [Candidatus Woesearchaeota archaeon]
MDVFEYFMKEARRSLDAAEHMRSVSYPLAEDPKIFLGVVSKLHEAHKSILKLVLLSNKDCSSVKECEQLPIRDFKKAFDLIQNDTTSAQVLSDKELSALAETYDLVLKHRDSPVEFPRKEQFVMCDDDYGTKQLSGELVRRLSDVTKQMLRSVFMKRDFILSSGKDVSAEDRV